MNAAIRKTIDEFGTGKIIIALSLIVVIAPSITWIGLPVVGFLALAIVYGCGWEVSRAIAKQRHPATHLAMACV